MKFLQVDKNKFGGYARRNVQKHEIPVRVLTYNKHICHMSNINAVFQYFLFSNFETFFKRTINLEWYSTICSERVKNIYPWIIYQIRGISSDKLVSLGIKYTSERKLFKKLAKFNFESFSVQEETFQNTKTTIWLRKHVPISASNFMPKRSKIEKLVPWYRANKKEKTG